MQDNMETLGDISFSKEEVSYANTILKESGKPQIGLDGKLKPLMPTLPATGGSTDVGDVSQVVPVIRMSATVAAKDGPWHSWAVVACTGMSIGHKVMLHAAKALGMSMIDIYKDKKLREEIKKEFDERIGDYDYDPYLNPGPPPIDYVD